jgi:hypothetical protein
MTRRSGLVLLLGAFALGCSSSDSMNEGASAPGQTIPSQTQAPTAERLVEEGDIVWLDDPILYVLNQTRGLSVVGLGNPAAPWLIGRVALQGTPVELYLHGGFILALTSGLSNSANRALESRLSVVDVRQPEQPIVVATVPLLGTTTNSRLVGDVLYTACDSGTAIQSVSLAEPWSPRLVDTLSLPGGSHGNHVHATSTTFYVATEFWSSVGTGECAGSNANDGCTIVQAVDISSPVGLLRRGASYAMTGMLKDRWGLDWSNGVLRVLVARGQWWTSGQNASADLRTFRAGTPAELEPLGWMPLATERFENVMAVRFDGPQAYIVTYRQTDPLFTIDISNPAKPFVAGHLQTPGWLDFIIPRGGRLLGVGRDQDGSGTWRLQASLYDVTNLASPRLMARTFFGNNYVELPDQADNLAKVVRVLDTLGVLFVPYNDKSVGYSASADGNVELISFANDTLAPLGRVASVEPIRRAVPLPPAHLAAVTENAVGVIQLTPALAVTGFVDLNASLAGAAGGSP